MHSALRQIQIKSRRMGRGGHGVAHCRSNLIAFTETPQRGFPAMVTPESECVGRITPERPDLRTRLVAAVVL